MKSLTVMIIVVMRHLNRLILGNSEDYHCIFIYLQLLGVAQFCVAMAWFVSTMCRPVSEGADIPPAGERTLTMSHSELSFIQCVDSLCLLLFNNWPDCVYIQYSMYKRVMSTSGSESFTLGV